MRISNLFHSRAVALVLSLGMLAWASPASAQLAKGAVSATCNVGGSPAQLYAEYEVYGDSQVWTERSTGRFSDLVQSGLTTTYWQGYINTAYGRFMLSGENRFVEAHPVGGRYSDKRTLEIISTGPNTFLLKDFFADNQPTFPCQVTGRK